MHLYLLKLCSVYMVTKPAVGIMSSVKTRPLFPDGMIHLNIFRGVSVSVLESNYYDP